MNQLSGGSAIQTANLEKKKKDFALCQQNAWNFDKYGGHSNGQSTCRKKEQLLAERKRRNQMLVCKIQI